MRLFRCLVPVVVLLLIKDASARPGLGDLLHGTSVGSLIDPLGVFKPKGGSNAQANSNAQAVSGNVNFGPIGIGGGFSSATSSASANGGAGGGLASASAKADAQANGYGGANANANANAQASSNANLQGSLGTPGGYYVGNNNYPGVSQPNQPNYGSYGGSQSSANANANANAIGNGGVRPVGPNYYPSGSHGGNANANANANAGANGGVNAIPNKYPAGIGGIDRIEVIPVNTLPLSRPTSPVVHPHPYQPGHNKGDVIPIIVVEESPRYPPYQRPGPSSHYQRHQPHYGNKPKQQPIEIIIIEETEKPGDTS